MGALLRVFDHFVKVLVSSPNHWSQSTLSASLGVLFLLHPNSNQVHLDRKADIWNAVQNMVSSTVQSIANISANCTDMSSQNKYHCTGKVCSVSDIREEPFPVCISIDTPGTPSTTWVQTVKDEIR